MKIAHWSRLRLEIAARHQAMTVKLSKLAGPAEVEEVQTVKVVLDDGTPVLKDGVQVEETRIVRTLTKRGTALQQLRDYERARQNILRTVG